MNRRAVLITGAAFLLAAFLIGFVPQYLKRRDVEQQLDAARQELATAGNRAQVDEISLLIGYVYLETNLKNYGIAGQYATRFFDRVRSLEDRTQNPTLRAFLEAALAKRDSVVGALAKGDPGALGDIQELFQRSLQVTLLSPPAQRPS